MENLTPIVSSNISHLGYDENTETLTVRFKAGGTYQYDRVPSGVYQELINSQSIGAYFASKIRNKYETRKLEVSFSPSQSS